MVIAVKGTLEPLFVDLCECRLEDGSLAFAIESMPPPPLPAWYVAPAGSVLRRQDDNRRFGLGLSEYYSAHGNVDEVFSFYREMADSAGLIAERPFGGVKGCHALRVGKGVLGLSVILMQYKERVFWSNYFTDVQRRSHRPFPLSLSYVERTKERVALRDDATNEQYWALVSAIYDSPPQPPPKPDRRTQPVNWALLPGWVHFGFGIENRGELARWSGENGETWSASVDRECERPALEMFQSCLADLDAHGFDGSGNTCSDRSYFVSLVGSQLAAYAKTEIGDQARVMVIDTLGQTTLSVQFEPGPNTRLPGV